MGVIQRQGFKHSLIGLLGTIIGALAIVFIYPKDTYTYGVLQFIIPIATLLMPFLSLGTHSLIIRFFPVFKSESRQHHGFLGLILLLAIASVLFCSALLFLFQDKVYQSLELLLFDVSKIKNHLIPIVLIAIILLFNKILTNYVSSFGRIVIPNILNTFSLKLLLPCLVLFRLFDIVSLPNVIWILVGNYLLIFLFLLVYTFSLGQLKIKPQLNFLTPALNRSMFVYALFGLISHMGSDLASQIDKIMISTLVDFESNGGYSIFLFMANTIQLPLLSLIAIGAPIIADKLQKQDYKGVQELYQKASLNGLIVGALLFIGIFCNLDDLLHMTGKYKELVPLKAVFLFIGLAKLFDLVTSLNTQIINYSKFFRFNLVVVIFLAFVNIINNYIFIKTLGYGAVGAAMATCISILLFNLLRLSFIWFKFKMLPFTKDTLTVIILIVLIIGISSNLTLNFPAIINILIRGSLIVAAYGFAILHFRVSEDINALVMKYWMMVKARF